MKTKSHSDDRPLYIITFASSVDIREVRQTRCIYNVMVKWDKYRNPRRVTQCHNCQQYGHGSMNCHREPRCLFCAGKHTTKTCTQSEEEKEKPTCANCAKGHRANNRECESYKSRLLLIEKSKEQATRQRDGARRKVPTQADFPRPSWDRQQSSADRAPTWTARANKNISASNTTSTANIEEFAEVAELIKKIRQLCNVSKMLGILRNLFARLQNCQTEQEQLAIFLECFNYES
ncbi:hypothetical protein QAD02_018758 [Eretmocerus hayati]|uniref:Uncharacterized protein n=1 Tax=Eretmocerus hayati TaxID=131215 RepID=A0ACC2PIW5_9HYME|nr:hypothetical protein QAD02_018758 [Eretmocerus hayati]